MNTLGSLGVGVQSSALYLMSCKGDLPKIDLFIFGNTGAEKTKTLEYYRFLLDWKGKNSGIPLYEASYKNLYKDLLSNTNSTGNTRFSSIPAFTKDDKGHNKGMLKRQCTGEYKIAQINKKYREILNIGRKNFPLTEVWIGISFDERHRMLVPQEKWKINAYPFCGWKVYSDGRTEKFPGYERTRDGIVQWYINNNIPIPKKSACKFCPYHSWNEWADLKETSPKDFEDACLIDERIRNSTKKGIKQPIYVHDSLKPLRSIPFKKMKGTFFDKSFGNCSDFCDV